MRAVLLLLVPFCFLPAIVAFSPCTPKASQFRQSSSLQMAPRYDPGTQKWLPQSDDDFPQAGYPPTGSLFRAGPKAFLMRVFNSEGYEQSVLKYMAREKCSRNEAQGNMDGKSYTRASLMAF